MTVSIYELFLWPLSVQLLVLLILAWGYRRRGYHDLRKPKAHIFRCTTCSHIYIDNRQVPISKCARCNTLNEMIRR